jgi:hypothetical protein
MLTAGKTLWMVLTLAVVGAAAALSLPFATRGANSLVVTEKVKFSIVSFPQAAANIVVGLKLRTTLVNRGTEPIHAVVAVFDRDGHLVKQDPVTVAPGTMQFSEVSCAAPSPSVAVPAPCPGAPGAPQADDGSTPLRTEVKIKEFTIVKNVDVATALVCDTTPGPTSCVGAKGTTGPASLERLSSNHNETLVRDAAPMR